MASNRHHLRSANTAKRPRQDPVSCGFCRSKKLKCDRQQPCSNCAARNLVCDGQSQSSSRNAQATADNDNVAILARLKRLEDIVLSQAEQSGPLTGSICAPSVVQSGVSAFPLDYISPTSEYKNAVCNLEEIGIREDPRIFPAHTGLELRISPTHQLSAGLDTPASFANEATPEELESKRFFLPPREEADLLLDYYVAYVNNLQHFLYVPAVRNIIDSLYTKLHHGVPVGRNHVALAVSIFASSAALCALPLGDFQQTLFQGSDPAQASILWINTALELLEQSRITTSGSFEDVQASIVLGFLMYHLEGWSARSRSLLTGAVAIARSLSLHKIDMHAEITSAALDHATLIENEIKRRVWWSLVSIDWVLALNGGPQEGTYLVHPLQMRVNMPRNLNDEDLMQGNPPVEKPISEPTTMSFSIQKIKLAHICRGVVDLMPLSNVDLTTIDYMQVIALDNQFEAYFNEMPVFLKTDPKSCLRSEHITHQYPYIKAQRYGLGMISHVRRCKLHQPFLTLRRSDGRYSLSREMSLKSARTVIHLKRLAEQEQDMILNTVMKFGWVVRHLFQAIIVLAMDLCYNKAEGDDDDARKAEVREACKLLEQSGNQSNVAGDYLNSLMNLLRKHKVRLHNLPSDRSDKTMQSDATRMPSSTNPTPEIGERDIQLIQSPWPIHESFSNYSSDFESIWKHFIENGPNLDVPEWENLFSELEAKQ